MRRPPLDLHPTFRNLAARTETSPGNNQEITLTMLHFDVSKGFQIQGLGLEGREGRPLEYEGTL